MKKFFQIAVIAAVMVAGASAAEVDGRLNWEQARINQGIRSGQLTPGETARLEGQQNRIRSEVAAERAMNGGRLTPGEWRQVNRQENRLSRNIYRDKHNFRRW